MFLRLIKLARLSMKMMCHVWNKCLASCLMCVFLLLMGCEDDALFEQHLSTIVEGIPVCVSLGYVSQENKVETRYAQGEVNERTINNIYLFVFNSAGQRQPLLENIETGNERSSSLFETYETNGAGKLEFVCGSLNSATIVAIANVTNENTATAYTVTEDELDAIENLPDLKKKIMPLSWSEDGTSPIFRGNLFMMTGYAKDKSGSTSIDIAGVESGSNGTVDLECTLQLERTDAKVEVNVTSQVPTGKNWTEFSFQPDKWRVCEIPAQSFLLPDDEKDADGTYFETIYRDFETVETNENGTQSSGGSFVFYMPENRKKPITEVSSYVEREAWKTEIGHEDPAKPGQSVANLSFFNANEHSTYLEITGQLSYIDENGKSVTADTRYYVHLGNTKENVNDYNTLRNHHYIYTITVQGVNDIVVDVQDKTDPRPGQEGSVIQSENEIFNFDCHYDRRLITLRKSDVMSDELSWGVSTPYSNGIHKIGKDIANSMRDYRWIKFAINKEYGVASNQYVKYPGDQNYNDPHPVSGMSNNQSSPYYNGGDGGFYPDARLRDINQLLTDLKADAVTGGTKFFDGDEVAITVFVDEFLYVRNPLEDNPQKDMTLWKTKSVNQPDRMLHIMSEGAQYSADGNSSVIHSLYTFKQKSIRTIYNIEHPDLYKAWGLEIVMETDRLPVDEEMTESANDLDNGRYNTWQYIREDNYKEGGWFEDGSYQDLHWTDVLNTQGHYELNRNHENVFYACLMRNRDLNGDNIVDENEVRWYLASINQLTDIYIGEFALDVNSRLYPYDPVHGNFPPNGNNSVYWHYASSTYNGNYTEGSWPLQTTIHYPYVVWAEEGPSKGNYKASKESNGANYAYRCVRNLGIDFDNPDNINDELDELIVRNGYTFDLSRLDPKALRNYYIPGAGNADIITNDEKSADNLPYRKFSVSPNDNYGSSDHDWNYYQTTNPCARDGYRVPNLRELLIFTSRMTDEYPAGGRDAHLLSNTSFSMKSISPYSDQGRQGYSYNKKDGSMGPGANLGRVRGVQDEP